MKVVLVGGTFDSAGGKPSRIAASLFSGFISKLMLGRELPQVRIFNGGSLDSMEDDALEATRDAAVVLWMPKVENGVSKGSVCNIKAANPTCLLITSKRNDESKYKLPDLIQHMLGLHSNLCIEITRMEVKGEGRFWFTVMDPLGNAYGPTGGRAMDPFLAGETAAERALFLLRLTRVGSTPRSGFIPAPYDEEFFAFVKAKAEMFAALIPTATVTQRFLGNASFRCSHGFPSFREGNTIYVSRRNVDKACIMQSGFVPVSTDLSEGSVLYGYNAEGGIHKPSVDTPVQVMLYGLYPNIRYMLHGHVYLMGNTRMTEVVLPCGCIEEVREIYAANPDVGTEAFAVNLRGHGFIAGASSVKVLNKLIEDCGMVSRMADGTPEMQEANSESWARRLGW